MSREKEFTEQIVVRVTPAMKAELQAWAESESRTLAQEVRHGLRKYLTGAW